jgi:hypothetical protein
LFQWTTDAIKDSSTCNQQRISTSSISSSSSSSSCKKGFLSEFLVSDPDEWKSLDGIFSLNDIWARHFQQSAGRRLLMAFWDAQSILLHFVDYRTQFLHTADAQHCSACRKQPV